MSRTGWGRWPASSWSSSSCRAGGFGFDVLADAGGVVVDLDGDLLEARGHAGDGGAGGDGVLAAHASHEVQRPAGVLGEVADVLVVAFVDDAVKPALGGP